MIEVQHAGVADLADIVDIYNHYVGHSHCTFDIEPFSLASRTSWWEQFDGTRWQCWGAGCTSTCSPLSPSRTFTAHMP